MYIDKKLLMEAKKIVFVKRNRSIAHLQRKLGIGYNRAAVIMEMIARGHRQHVHLFLQKRKRVRSA
ncbi:MAG: hypothetical protein B5M52_01980 [Helicobacteraceae bacterium 4484_230]|nr:MAG: hypothetical protein B5M52_01980 [Helicobacteraceae bacterium 4484_230]